MLRTDFMPGSHDAALQKREGAFDGISMNLPHNIKTLTVRNPLVTAPMYLCFYHGRDIGTEVVSENSFDILAYVVFDVLRQRAGLNVFGVEEPKVSPALADSD